MRDLVIAVISLCHAVLAPWHVPLAHLFDDAPRSLAEAHGHDHEHAGHDPADDPHDDHCQLERRSPAVVHRAGQSKDLLVEFVALPPETVAAPVQRLATFVAHGSDRAAAGGSLTLRARPERARAPPAA